MELRATRASFMFPAIVQASQGLGYKVLTQRARSGLIHFVPRNECAIL